jgi:hypothetical protein
MVFVRVAGLVTAAVRYCSEPVKKWSGVSPLPHVNERKPDKNDLHGIIPPVGCRGEPVACTETWQQNFRPAQAKSGSAQASAVNKD